ncbi:helix-turn-helix transcriptional regulator [Spectribacter hydrogenooxidans]|uniref:MarR family transcriptional regulator n=1 Tax=Spectribacter hydrogenoxidans TaxID=3075608 RepID=A0ABU3C2B2_9GAMM|nr:helix-turn-helix domain-containing protein [Salinisphaera sp. W335]MDT0635698.1 MarR family transcriptional regulator [Salinisphaera sp. W335]
MDISQTDLDAFPPTRARILRLIKASGSASLRELAAALDQTRENARQQLQELKQGGWIRGQARAAPDGRGRPAMRYTLTSAGDHLFPKHYDDLTVILLDMVERRHGEAALHQTMRDLTDAGVAQWHQQLADLDLADRIQALRGIYFEDDPYTEVDDSGGEYRLIEKNCPYLNVAMQRPQMCSITVSTLTRLLGYRVVREKRFQDGDHRCVFRVLRHQPVDADRFAFELEADFQSAGE